MILFIGHEASFTGAPKILFELCNWLKNNKNEEIEIILRKGGPLLSKYEEIAPVKIWQVDYVFYPSIIKRFINSLKKNNEQKIFEHIKKNSSKYTLIFSNTITNGEILSKVKPLVNCKIITRVSELECVMKQYNTESWVDVNLKISDCFIAISEAVKINLITNHGINENKIMVSPDFVQTIENTNSAIDKVSLKKQLKIPENSFVVAGCGTLIWRKGPDIFVSVRNHLKNKLKVDDIFFLWIGGDKKSVFYNELTAEINKLNLEKHILITGEINDVAPYYNMSDVFLMTSREEPFGTVNLEAAQQGLPIICFDKSGGPPEFVTEDVGFVVPYHDIEAMADKVILLKSNKALAQLMSSNIKEKVKQYSLTNMAAQIYQLIKNYKK